MCGKPVLRTVGQVRNALLVALLLLLAGNLPAWADQEEAARRFAEGQTLLAQGDLKAALEAFSAAAKADPDNAEYRQEAVVLRRVLDLRGQLATAENDEAWQQKAKALYAYYRSRDVWKEAAALAQQWYEKSPGAESAALLAEAKLALNQNAEAVTLLAGLPAEQATPTVGVLHGLALARLGKLDEARTVTANLELPKDCPGIVCYHAARLQALLGDSEQALKTLTCAFECTPAGELARLKEQAKACTDLGGLRSTAGFVQALQTESKIKGGCGGCTKACPSAKGGDKKTEGCTEHQQPKNEPCEHGKH